MQLGRARGDDETVEALGPDVGLDLLLGGIGAGEHRGLRHDDVARVPDVLDDLLDIDVVGDVAAAVADIHTDASSAVLARLVDGGEGHVAHAGTITIWGSAVFVRSRCAATWAAAAPAWTMESAMSLAPDAAPAT